MIGFDIEVNIYGHSPQISKTATFSATEYSECKRLAEKFADAFLEKDSNCDFFVSYNIYDDAGRRKTGTTMLVKELP